jgi:hypothetical protein
MSESPAKTWPGAIKSKRVSRWDIHIELEELVKASAHDDSDEDDDEKRSSSSKNDKEKFHLNDGWQRKGIRQLRRERRVQSEGTAPSLETV